jgi:hypothetical protein
LDNGVSTVTTSTDEQSYAALRARIGVNLRTHASGEGGATLEQIASIERMIFDALTAPGLQLDNLQLAPAVDRPWATRCVPNFVRGLTV